MSENLGKKDDQEIQIEEKSIPKEFLDDVWISPHINIDPENEKHAEYLNKTIRNDLWVESFQKISDIEMKFLRNDNDFMKIKQVKPCTTSDSYIQQFVSSNFYEINESTDSLLRCEEWTLNLNDKSEVSYRVKHFQTESDRFFSVVFPSDPLRYFYLAQTQYRIKFY